MTRKLTLHGYIFFLKNYVFVRLWPITFLFVFLALELALLLSLPQVLRVFIDTASNEGGIATLKQLAALYLFTAALLHLVSWSSRLIGKKIAWKSTNQLRLDLLQHAMHTTTGELAKFSNIELVERIDGDVIELNNFLSVFVFTFLSNCLLIIGIFVMLSLESITIAVATVLIVLIAAILVYKIRNFAASFWEGLREVTGKFFGLFGSMVLASKSISFTGNKPLILKRVSERLLEVGRQKRLAFVSFSLIWASIVLATSLSSGAAIYISSYFWTEGALTIGSIYMILYYTEMMTRPIETLRNQLDDLQRADAGMRRVRSFFDLELEDGGVEPFPTNPTSVSLEDICMQYGEQMVLENFSCSFKRGELTAVIGKSGSGKSTLVKLLLRLHAPNSGRITVDGRNIDTFSLPSLRGGLCYLSQASLAAPVLVRDLFDSHEERNIEKALRRCFLEPWLSSLSEGLDTPLTLGTKTLSSGQKQLLSFAIALDSKSTIVVLDEHTALLDPKIEKHIVRQTKALARRKIVIIVAHNETPISYSDAIIRLAPLDVEEKTDA